MKKHIKKVGDNKIRNVIMSVNEDKIVVRKGKTMKNVMDIFKHLVENFEPQNHDLDKNRCEVANQSSMELLREVLEDCKKTKDLNIFVSAYMSYHYLLEETGMIACMDVSELDRLDEELLKGIEDQTFIEYIGYLKLCFKYGIDHIQKTSKYMKAAIALEEGYELPYYYLTIIELKKRRSDFTILENNFTKCGSLGQLLYHGLESDALPNIAYEGIDFDREYSYVINLIKTNKDLLKANKDLLESNNKYEDSNKQLIESNYEIEDKNKRITKIEGEKEALINKHAHNWKHIVYPQTVKRVAEEMYNRGEKEVANTLFHAYNSQSLLQKDLNLLQLQYASTSQEFCRKFNKSIYKSKDRRGSSIVDVFEYALQIVLFRLVMDGVDQRYATKEIKENIFSHYNLLATRESYVNSFIKGDVNEMSIVQWFSNNFYQLSIINDDLWSDVKFEPEGLAFIQMTEVFIDLIHNALNYGVKSKDGFIKLIFGKEQIDGLFIYTCEMKNLTDIVQTLVEGSGQGLKSINEVMSKLNNSNSKNVSYKYTEKSSTKEEFSFIFRLPKEIISRS